jgi:hypothetical protein
MKEPCGEKYETFLHVREGERIWQATAVRPKIVVGGNGVRSPAQQKLDSLLSDKLKWLPHVE